jgi:hypothetical protein
MATFFKFNCFVGDLGRGIHDLRAAGHVVKAYLSNAAPSATLDSVKGDVAEIAGGNGYTAGGYDIQNDWTESSGTATLTGVDIAAASITAAGGTIGPFQYVVLYNDTSATDPLIGAYDYGQAITLAIGESFAIDFGASVLTVGP